MSNEIEQPYQLTVTGQDVVNVIHILEDTGVSLPISYEGERKSWQLPVTEEFLKGISAQRKRLKSRNLKIHKQSLDMKESIARWGGFFAEECSLHADGIYQIGYLRKCWKRCVTYMRYHKKVSSFTNNTWIHYYMKKEPGEETKVSSMDVSFFPVLYGRGVEYSEGNAPHKSRGVLVALSVIAILSWLLSSILLPLGVILMLMSSTFFYGTVLLRLLCWSVGIGIGTTWLAVKCKLWQKWRLDSKQVATTIRERTTDFCMEKFISTINSQVLRLYYADDMDEITDFISCTVTEFLKDHANVVNVELLNFWFTGFREDGRYMYMDITQRVRLERDKGRQIERSKETIMLQLMKPIQGIMSDDLYSDWSVVRVETHE